MPQYRLKVWTGPVDVVQWGRKFRRAGLKVPIVGTEHLYVDVKEASSCAAAQHNMRAMLRRKYKKDWGFKYTTCKRRRSVRDQRRRGKRGDYAKRGV